jgi:hypothetical protein
LPSICHLPICHPFPFSWRNVWKAKKAHLKS